MPDSRGYRLPQWSWAAGAALALAALAALGHWFIRLSREQSWAAIETAAESKQWTEVEKGLRRWLGERPDDDKAWMMLGSLLFDQGQTGILAHGSYHTRSDTAADAAVRSRGAALPPLGTRSQHASVV